MVFHPLSSWSTLLWDPHPAPNFSILASWEVRMVEGREPADGVCVLFPSPPSLLPLLSFPFLFSFLPLIAGWFLLNFKQNGLKKWQKRDRASFGCLAPQMTAAGQSKKPGTVLDFSCSYQECSSIWAIFQWLPRSIRRQLKWSSWDL